MIKTIPLYHLELVRDRSIPFTSVTQVDQVAEILHELLDRSPVEQMLVMHVDPLLNIVGVEKIGLGWTTGVGVTMADIFRGAIAASVPNIILGHNHPVDDPTPSREDWDLTDRARYMGEQLGIRLLDHIIVTPTGKHISMKEEDAKQQGSLANKVLDAIANLPPDKQKMMEDNMRRFNLSPDFLLNKKNDSPLPSLTDLMKYKLDKLDKLNNSNKI